MMHVSVELGGLLLCLGAVLATWIDVRTQLALTRRDMQWLMGQLKKWGFVPPSNGV